MKINFMSIKLRCYFLLPALLLSPLTLAQTYRWTDDNGKVHFSDKPPVGYNAQDISQDLKNSNVDHSGDNVTKQLQQSRNDRSARQVEIQQQQRLSYKTKQQHETACLNARKNLMVLRGRVIFFDENGNEQQVTEKMRAQQAVKLENLIKKNCK